MRWLREAATLAGNQTPLPFMPQVLGELAHAAALAGDLATAQAALCAAERYTTDGTRLFHLWVALARPWEAVARGERSTAVALAMELAEQARSRGQVNVQLQALHDVARLGEPSRVSHSLHEAAAGVEGQLAPLYVAHADALSSHDAVALDRVASQGTRLPRPQPASSRGRSRSGKPASSSRTANRGYRRHNQSRRARHPMRRSANPRPGRTPVTRPHPPRTGDRNHGCTRAVQQGDRRTARRICAHCRQHPAPGICQARGKQQGRSPSRAGTRA